MRDVVRVPPHPQHLAHTHPEHLDARWKHDARERSACAVVQEELTGVALKHQRVFHPQATVGTHQQARSERMRCRVPPTLHHLLYVGLGLCGTTTLLHGIEHLSFQPYPVFVGNRAWRPRTADTPHHALRAVLHDLRRLIGCHKRATTIGGDERAAAKAQRMLVGPRLPILGGVRAISFAIGHHGDGINRSEQNSRVRAGRGNHTIRHDRKRCPIHRIALFWRLHPRLA